MHLDLNCSFFLLFVCFLLSPFFFFFSFFLFFFFLFSFLSFFYEKRRLSFFLFFFLKERERVCVRVRVCVSVRTCVYESLDVRACVCAFMLYALNFDNMYLHRTCKRLGPVRVRRSKYSL